MLPAWLLPTVADVRAECDARPRELFTLTADEDADDPQAADEAKLVALVTSHIEKQGAIVWGKLASESRSMPFPLTESVLQTAYPLPTGATEDDEEAQGEINALTIETQKDSARLLVKELVISKLWYGVTGEDAAAKAKNAYITAQQMTGELVKQITRTRRAWLSNSVTLDPFY